MKHESNTLKKQGTAKECGSDNDGRTEAKEGKPTSTCEKYKTMDYGSTGQRNKPNTKAKSGK